MRFIVLLVMMVASVPAFAEGSTLCGWLDNPTPNNYFLTDSRTQWVLSGQGSDPDDLEALDALMAKLPEFPRDDDRFWNRYEPHRSYGYGCACLYGAITQNESQPGLNTRILSITRSKMLPLARCRSDTRLPPID